MQNYKIINTQSELIDIIDFLEKENAFAFDMEADSMFHFKEKVCLIQLATKSMSAVIDPLSIPNISALKSIFANPDIKKISHGSDYDVRSLYRDFDIKINNLFDTQLACRFLGIKNTGLEAILESKFNVKVNKKYQKKDWSQRPLPEDMIRYAANDVIHLIDLAEIFEKELIQKRRLCWFNEECEVLSKVRPTQPGETPLYLNFKGAGKLNRRKLAILEALLIFRKSVAEKKDKPLFKIIGNNELMKIVQAKPVNMQELQMIRALSLNQTRMYGNKILTQIKNASKVAGEKLPVYPNEKAPVISPSNHVLKRMDLLKSWRRQKSNTLEIEPSLIFNKIVLKSIAMGNPKTMDDFHAIKGMKNWQKQEFSKDIISVLKQADVY